MRKKHKGSKVIVFAGQKGGIGKTTLTLNFALEAVFNGHAVTIIDTNDEQSSMELWGKLREKRDIKYPNIIRAHPRRLEEKAYEAAENGSTLILVDTAPSIKDGVEEAIDLADLVLIPVMPTLIEVHPLLKTVNILRRKRTPARIIFNRVDPRSKHLLAEGYRSIEHFELTAAPKHIVQRIAFQHAYNLGLAVVEYEHKSKAAAEIRALYAYITKEMKDV